MAKLDARDRFLLDDDVAIGEKILGSPEAVAVPPVLLLEAKCMSELDLFVLVLEEPLWLLLL